LDLNAVSGSFVVNPPIHCDDLIEAALNHIDRLLSESSEPLSFIIFLADGETTFVQKLDSSQFKRRQVVIPAYEHYYRHGFQYSVPKYIFNILHYTRVIKNIYFINFFWFFRTDVNIRSPTSTLVVWLQNNAGCQRWSPSEDRVEALLEAFRPGRERDRDRQELLSPTPNPLLGPPPLPV